MDKKIAKKILKEISLNFSPSWFLNKANHLEDHFSDDALTVAKTYRENLEIATSEHGIDSNTISNAKLFTMKDLCQVVKVAINPCPRCDGTGRVPFRHVKDGICFKCEGSGKAL